MLIFRCGTSVIAANERFSGGYTVTVKGACHVVRGFSRMHLSLKPMTQEDLEGQQIYVFEIPKDKIGQGECGWPKGAPQLYQQGQGSVNALHHGKERNFKLQMPSHNYAE